MTPDQTLQRADQELDQAERLISLAMAARRLNSCPRTIRRWVDSGRLPAVRMPSGRWRVSSRVVAEIRRGSR